MANRCSAQLAGYWEIELWASGFGQYVWRRLLTMSAEECWRILTAEAKALHDSYTEINKTTTAKKPKGRIFISEAVILLCMAKKSRDADHLQNFIYDQQAGLEPETLTDELERSCWCINGATWCQCYDSRRRDRDRSLVREIPTMSDSLV
ncbi:MAG: hypothetical protein WED15_07540 [Akkermansiaceae bacterium]